MKKTILSVSLILTVFLAGCVISKVNREERPIIGAVRWDGLFADSIWAQNLEPPEYHHRLPFYTTWKNGKPIIDADKQEVMDKEIRYASNSGLDYWAFVYYYPTSWPEADKYNYGWKRYLASEHQNDINFCLVLQGPHLGPRQQWQDTVESLVDFFTEPTYQKVLGDRPLVYMFYVHKFEEIFGPGEKAKDALDYLRKRAVHAGLGQPYIVAQVFDAKEGADYVDRIGFDAIGAYSKHNDERYSEQREYPYSALAGINNEFWQACKNVNKEVVPVVNAGWDVRPRWWDAELMKHYQGKHHPYFTQPTPSELANHLQSAMNWVTANRQVAKANAVLIYAWNEMDEGGWLVPTESEGTARLDAIKKVLKKQ